VDSLEKVKNELHIPISNRAEFLGGALEMYLDNSPETEKEEAVIEEQFRLLKAGDLLPADFTLPGTDLDGVLKAADIYLKSKDAPAALKFIYFGKFETSA